MAPIDRATAARMEKTFAAFAHAYSESIYLPEDRLDGFTPRGLLEENILLATRDSDGENILFPFTRDARGVFTLGKPLS